MSSRRDSLTAAARNHAASRTKKPCSAKKSIGSTAECAPVKLVHHRHDSGHELWIASDDVVSARGSTAPVGGPLAPRCKAIPPGDRRGPGVDEVDGEERERRDDDSAIDRVGSGLYVGRSFSSACEIDNVGRSFSSACEAGNCPRPHRAPREISERQQEQDDQQRPVIDSDQQEGRDRQTRSRGPCREDRQQPVELRAAREAGGAQDREAGHDDGVQQQPDSQRQRQQQFHR